MTKPTQNRRLLLERYADGELGPTEVAEVELLLDRDPAAVAYLDALAEMRTILRLPADAAADRAQFAGLFDRVMGAVEATEPTPLPARDAELEMLAMAYLDGQLENPADVARAKGYLARCPQAREGAESIATMGALLRGTFERAEARVDFEALGRRVGRALDRVDQERTQANRAIVAKQPSALARLLEWIGGGKAIFAGALGAAAVALVMIPMVRPAGEADLEDKPATVINNFYGVPLTSVESVEFQSGFQGTWQAGDPEQDLVPVIWITPDSPPGSEGTEGTGMQVEYDPAAGIPTGKPL
jgi:anti-sigma factor RsiW